MTDLSEFSDTALAETLRALQSEDFPIEAAGFTGAEVDELLEGLAGEAAGAEEGSVAGESWEGRYELVVECRSEEDQRALYERLTAEGLTCRVLTL